MRLQQHAARLVYFGGVGAIATALQYMVLAVGVELTGTTPVVASGVGFVLSCLANYALNYRYTFRSTTPHVIAAPRFIAVATSGLVLNIAGMSMLSGRLGIPYLIAQLGATAVVLCWNYAWNSLWSFQDSASTVSQQVQRKRTP